MHALSRKSAVGGDLACTELGPALCETVCCFELEQAKVCGIKAVVGLTDVLPDTDGEGEPMSSHALAGRWQYNVAEVLKHLMKKHEGELAELKGNGCGAKATSKMLFSTHSSPV